MLTALEWGWKDPEEFWNLPRWKKALMIATIEAKYEMSAYEDQTSRNNAAPADPRLVSRE